MQSQKFLTELRAWLARYGQRLNSVFTLNEPSWIEDPTPAIQNLQAYVAQPDLQPEMESAALVAEREKAVAEARAKLAGYPQPVVARFETLLKAAQVAAVVHEDHNFWIDQRLFYHVRRLIIDLGSASPGRDAGGGGRCFLSHTGRTAKWQRYFDETLGAGTQGRDGALQPRDPTVYVGHSASL